MHPRWVFWPTIRSVGATKNPQVQQVQPGFPPGRAFATGDLQPPVARRWFDDDHFLSLLMLANMGVSENRGTPKWMVYNRKPYSNGRFGGKTHYFRSAIHMTFQEFHGMDFFFVKKISSFGPFFLKTHSHAQACTKHAFFSHFWPKKPNLVELRSWIKSHGSPPWTWHGSQYGPSGVWLEHCCFIRLWLVLLTVGFPILY